MAMTGKLDVPSRCTRVNPALVEADQEKGQFRRLEGANRHGHAVKVHPAYFIKEEIEMVEGVTLQRLKILGVRYQGIFPGKRLKRPRHVEPEFIVKFQLLLDVAFNFPNRPIKANNDIGLMCGQPPP